MVESELLNADEAVRKANLLRIQIIPDFIIKSLNKEIVESIAGGKFVIKFSLINRDYSDLKDLLVILLKERGYKNVTPIYVNGNAYIQFNV